MYMFVLPENWIWIVATRKAIGNYKGGGERVSKAKHGKGKYEPNFEFWGGRREGPKQKTFSLRDIDIFWKTCLGRYGWRNFLSIRRFGMDVKYSWYTAIKPLSFRHHYGWCYRFMHKLFRNTGNMAPKHGFLCNNLNNFFKALHIHIFCVDGTIIE